MTNEQEKDNNTLKAKTDRNRKISIIVGVICILVCIIGILYIWHRQKQKPPVQLDVNSAVATVDIDKLLVNHSDYGKLEKLQAENDFNFDEIKILYIKYRAITTATSKSS